MRKSGLTTKFISGNKPPVFGQRLDRFRGKLYLEFGGKLFDDFHAARVFARFDVNGKVK